MLILGRLMIRFTSAASAGPCSISNLRGVLTSRIAFNGYDGKLLNVRTLPFVLECVLLAILNLLKIGGED